MSKIISASILLFVLTACATPGNSTSIFSSELEQVNSNIANLEKTLSQQIANDCRQDNEKLVAVSGVHVSLRKEATLLGVKKKEAWDGREYQLHIA